MKKIVSVICIVVMLLSVCALTVSANPKDDIMAAVDANVPADVVAFFRTQAVNILNQINVTDEQAAQVIAIVKEAGPRVKSGSFTLHKYGEEDTSYFLAKFDQVCTILGLTYKFGAKKNPVHKSDDFVYLYDASGKLIAELDGDPINDTGASESNNTLLITLLSVLAVVAAISVGYGVKKSMSHE